MYYTHPGRNIAPREIRDYARIFREIDEERRELAAFAVRQTAGFGAEITRHKDHLHDLAEEEELMMIRTRYVDFEPHWRAHRRFQSFLRTAESRAELLFCSDWLRQHEAAEDTEFHQWLQHGCRPDANAECFDCLYGMDPERILLSVKMHLV